MTTATSRHRPRGLTRFNVAVILGCVAVLAVLVSLGLITTRNRAQRVNCFSNLRSIGLSFRMWANDNSELFPWLVPTNYGTKELAESADVYRHFTAIDKELSSPKVLACSADTARSRVVRWDDLDNAHLSYFVGLDASETNAQSILLGDRNLLGGLRVTNTVVRFTNGSPVTWGPDIHRYQGNLGLGDGSALYATDTSVRTQIQVALRTARANDLRISIP